MRETTRTDKCRLCLEQKELVRSHLIPRAVYDLCRPEGSSPVRVGDGVVMPTDRQVQDYLLCAACEDILNRGGESWVAAKLASWDRKFPLYYLIVSAEAEYKEPDGGLYFAAKNSGIDVEKLTHFGMGILWKAAVHSWQGRKREPMIELGPYAGPVRTWLRGQSSFPRHACLSVVVSPPERAQITINPPVEAAREAWRTFWFHVPGVLFTLHVGKQIDLAMRMTCFHENPTHPVLVSGDVTRQLELRNAEHFQGSRKTRAYLESKTKRQKQS